MLFAELNELIYLGPPTANRSGGGGGGGGGRRGLRPVRRHPATAVFWDAHVWCDVLRSVEDDRPAFPWGFGHAGRSEVWQRRLGYRRAQFSDKFIRMRSRTRARHSSPYAPPDEPHAAEWAALATHGQRLSYMPLCAPRRYRVWGDSPRARQAAARGGGRGCLRSGSLLFAPPWLVSQVRAWMNPSRGPDPPDSPTPRPPTPDPSPLHPEPPRVSSRRVSGPVSTGRWRRRRRPPTCTWSTCGAASGKTTATRSTTSAGGSAPTVCGTAGSMRRLPRRGMNIHAARSQPPTRCCRTARGALGFGPAFRRRPDGLIQQAPGS